EYVIAHTARAISSANIAAYDEYGNFLITQVPGTSIEPARMQAWNVSAWEIDDVIRIDFTDGGPCSMSFDIKNLAAVWKVVATGVACD
ncbi:hypothetical protein, partial [Herbaspirillum chlorophenolicum]